MESPLFSITTVEHLDLPQLCSDYKNDYYDKPLQTNW